MSEIDRALGRCIAVPSRRAISDFRTLAEDLLIERLTILTSDPSLIRRGVDRAFERFETAIQRPWAVNWMSWLVATACSVVTHGVNPQPWFGALSDSLPGGPSHERHALLFGAILTLDGRCQWLLMSAVGRPKQGQDLVQCQMELERRIALVTR